MFVKTEIIDGRPIIHERGQYELTIATVEDGSRKQVRCLGGKRYVVHDNRSIA